jgi:hypothetical protein
MQFLLSQRPKGGRAHRAFSMIAGTVMPHLITNPEQLPTWSDWLRDYAQAIGYSVRHIQRLVHDEARKKIVKECGWSVGDHNRAILAATLGYDLACAIEAARTPPRWYRKSRKYSER